MSRTGEWVIEIHNQRMVQDAEYADRYRRSAEADAAEYYAIRVDDAAADAAAENDYWFALQDERDQQQDEADEIEYYSALQHQRDEDDAAAALLIQEIQQAAADHYYNSRGEDYDYDC
jgi:hypothetical protein